VSTLSREPALKLLDLLQAPRDHPPCGTPVPEGPFLFSNASTTTLLPRQRIRLALRRVQPARIRSAGAPVEGCADTGPALSSPDTAGWAARGSAAAGWHHYDGARESPLGAVSGTDGNGHGHDAVSRPHRREGYTLTPQKRPGPPLTSPIKACIARPAKSGRMPMDARASAPRSG